MKYCKHNSVYTSERSVYLIRTTITTGASKLSNVDTHFECDFGEYNRTQCCSSSIISSYQFKNSKNNYH
ncbi:hypothetical protein DERP_005015 [Dermatophagoides pteronyssinus]|uniref:Uncharacterized protein n=1 Tax=Dermatophagoides pteronyssinus TaxID=6956 RepID=A0ABQ8JT82_DERPT|nr:hypothetical protein DERP_005015 [Dermatophagoides pteronyssinus]